MEAIKTKTEALTAASMKIGEAMYKDKQAAEAAAPEEAASEGDGKVVDADYEDLTKK